MRRASDPGPQVARLKTTIRGAVQGVGFRPFVFRLATEMGLTGWVNNSPQGVFIEVEGVRDRLEEFLSRLEAEKPAQSFIQSLEACWLDAVGHGDFQIRKSEQTGAKSALVTPDIATCGDCLREIFDPQNRRYLYPFTNCTHCGPRFSIIESLPYDRAHSSMKRFTMCPQCQAEYDNPLDRRFHAQPNACPVCGPRLELWDAQVAALARAANDGGAMGSGSRETPGPGRPEARAAGNREALARTAEAIRAGKIVAVKGLGGFQLMVAASDQAAVLKLRERKHREEKPFAVMFPSLEAVREVCEVLPLEERLLRSPEAPLVLLRRLPVASSLAWSAVAPGNPNLGVMVPYTPLHHLLLGLLGSPVVATSGNLSDEPICIDEHEALERLHGIADCFLVHDRPIVRHVDDSIVRVMAGRELVLRRARGYAPLPFTVRSVECGVRNAGLQLTRIRDSSLKPSTQLHSPSPLPSPQGEGEFSPVGERIAAPQTVSPRHPATPSPWGEGRGEGERGVPSAQAGPEPPNACKDRILETPSALTTVLAVGAHLKNAIALAVGPQVFISQHIGDLETAGAYDAFRRVITDLQGLYTSPASLIVADAHPDYLSTKFAQSAGVPCLTVQHHLAHVLSCMAENELEPPVLGVSWDGTGYGLDGTIWGGEFFRITKEGYERVGHFRPFRLPGGEQAVREPRRAALGLLYEAYGESAFDMSHLATFLAFSSSEVSSLSAMLRRQINSPLTSSAGRLFDAVASLVGLRQRTRFEGQAAMELEFLAGDGAESSAYEVALNESSTPFVLDWRPGVDGLLADLGSGLPRPNISSRFHNMLIESILKVIARMDCERVVLSGGCFQNRYLTERAVRRLQEKGFRPYWHQRIPPNDGGICLGQVVAARWWRV